MGLFWLGRLRKSITPAYHLASNPLALWLSEVQVCDFLKFIFNSVWQKLQVFCHKFLEPSDGFRATQIKQYMTKKIKNTPLLCLNLKKSKHPDTSVETSNETLSGIGCGLNGSPLSTPHRTAVSGSETMMRMSRIPHLFLPFSAAAAART